MFVKLTIFLTINHKLFMHAYNHTTLNAPHLVSSLCILLIHKQLLQYLCLLFALFFASANVPKPVFYCAFVIVMSKILANSSLVIYCITLLDIQQKCKCTF